MLKPHCTTDLRAILKEWRRLRVAIHHLKKAGHLNTQTIVAPLNKLLSAISGTKLCGIDPATLVNIITTTLNNYKKT